MTVFIVTIRLPKLPDHNPKHKITRLCRYGPGQCTDSMGEHHSFLHIGGDKDTVEKVRILYEEHHNYHVTRVEEA